MKEHFYLNLGHLELLTLIVRNGLFNGSWNRLRHEIQNGNLYLPGIQSGLIDRLKTYEKKYRLNLNQVLLSSMYKKYRNSTLNRKKPIQQPLYHTCYVICRGLFSYPCVAFGNRRNSNITGDNFSKIHRLRPGLVQPGYFNSPYYQGVNRMKENPIKFSNSANPHHDQLIEQLNKIRECYPCDNQPNCMDYQYVQKATDTVIKEFHLENSFTGKLLARSFCWMSAEESRLMRIVEKEGAMIEPQSFYPMDDESLSEEFYNPAESEDFNSENRENPELIGEPHPLWEVINDLRESMRDSIRLMAQMTKIT